MMAKQSAERRMGRPGSDNWLAMLDAAENILSEQGYGALTSRAVAENIGVKQRLVYYYFRTMNELIVETFRRLATRELERLEIARAERRPLEKIWNMFTETNDARLVSEFMALANRNDDLRREVASFVEKSRQIEIEVLAAALDRTASVTGKDPAALVLIATGLALTINRERMIGVDTGHEGAKHMVSDLLGLLEPSP